MAVDPAGNVYINTRTINAVTEGVWLLTGGLPSNVATQIIPPFTAFGEGTETVVPGPHRVAARARRTASPG